MPITPAGHRPLKRKVAGGKLGSLVIELRAETVAIRPYRGHTPLFEATYSEIVYAVLLNREPKRKKRKPKKGRKR